MHSRAERPPEPPTALKVGDQPPIGIVGRIYRNLGKLIGGKAGAGIISLAYMAIAVRVLGPHDYGVLILVHTFAMTVGGLIEFPGWHAVVRYGAQAMEDGDEPRLGRLLRFAASVEGLGGICAILSALLLAPLVGPHLGWSQTAQDFAVPYSFAVLASIRATPAGLLQLLGRFDLLGAHVVISPLVRLIGSVFIALTGGGLYEFLVVWLAAALVEWASMWALGAYVARSRSRDTPLLGPFRGAVQENKGIWRFMIGANADATFSDLVPRLAPLAVGWVMGPVAAALFAVAQRATVIISQPAQLLGQAAYSELARLIAGGADGAAVRHALFRSVGIALAIALPPLALIAIDPHPIARLIGGKAFENAGDIMVLLAISRAILLVGPPASATLVALGRPGLSAFVNIGVSLGMLPLLPPMMNWFGLRGAGVHSILQAIVAGSLLAWFVIRESGKVAPVHGTVALSEGKS